MQPPPDRLAGRPPCGVCLRGQNAQHVHCCSERAGVTLDSAHVENIQKSFSELRALPVLSSVGNAFFWCSFSPQLLHFPQIWQQEIQFRDHVSVRGPHCCSPLCVRRDVRATFSHSCGGWEKVAQTSRSQVRFLSRTQHVHCLFYRLVFELENHSTRTLSASSAR